MKPFNLEEAKAGAPVCTKDGHSVRITCFDAKNSHFSIVALVDFPESGEEKAATYELDGKMAGSIVDDYNLFMAEDENHYDISNFKPFDKVLARDTEDEKWCAAFFSYYEIDKDVQFQFPFVTASYSYVQCIPYNEETEHLVGTDEMPPKKYINW